MKKRNSSASCYLPLSSALPTFFHHAFIDHRKYRVTMEGERITFTINMSAQHMIDQYGGLLSKGQHIHYNHQPDRYINDYINLPINCDPIPAVVTEIERADNHHQPITTLFNR